MEQHLSQIRDKIIKDGYDMNKNIPKPLIAKALGPEITVPTLYRILDGRIVDSQISQLNVIAKACQKT